MVRKIIRVWFRKDFYTINAYSPYDNVSHQVYPHLFVEAGLNDPRVGYWEPAKWVARLREVKAGDRDVLMKVHMGAGHAGTSGRYGKLRDVSLCYAFVLHTLGVVPGAPTA